MHRNVFALAVVVLSAAGCARTTNIEEERNALMAADRQWSESARDLDSFMSFYVPDASSYPPGMPELVGTDAIRKTFAGIYASPGFALSWTASKAEVAASGDVGWTAGTYEMTMGGVKDSGKYVTLWKKQPEGTWKVAADIFNSNLPPTGPPAQHVMVAPGAVKWGPAPPGLPPGAEVAVMSGDPSQAGQPFVIRARVPAGWRVAPHWHPTTESLTVLSGTVALGMGEQFNDGAMTELGAGGFFTVPAEMRHYFVSRTAATFQVHGTGPFAVNYVNPADDPSRK